MDVRIILSAHGQGKVFIDGEELHKVSSLSLKAGVGETNELAITFVPDSVTVEGVADVTSIGDDSRKFKQVD